MRRYPSQKENWQQCRHWRDSRSRENLERIWSIFFYLELENWIFISRDALECQDFEEKILIFLSQFEILKKILFHFSKEWDFANRFSFSSRFFTQCLFQFSWEIIFCSLGWFWPSVFCRKGKYLKRQFCVVEQYSDFSLHKHFMETTTTKSHLWEYFEWLPSGKGIYAKHARMRSLIDLVGEWGPEEEEKRLIFLLYLILATKMAFERTTGRSVNM